MTTNTFIYILAGYVTAAGPRTVENVNIKHWGRNYRAAGIRTRDLLNPIQAHYQAVLRPDLEAHY
jgi:hypothetical protein